MDPGTERGERVTKDTEEVCTKHKDAVRGRHVGDAPRL